MQNSENPEQSKPVPLDCTLGTRMAVAQIYNRELHIKEPCECIFHMWGAEYEEFENGAAVYSVAIVELKCGQVHTVIPSDIQFVST